MERAHDGMTIHQRRVLQFQPVLGVAVREEVKVMAQRAHDGMTIHQRRVLQFQLEALGLEEKYVELNGQMPLAEYGWEPEVEAPEPPTSLEMPPLDGWLDPRCGPYEGDDD